VVVLIALASAVGADRRLIGLRRGRRGRRSRSRVPPPSRPTRCSPVAVFAIHRFALEPDIWLSPLMVLGTQWYILFNVIAGASAFPDRPALRWRQSRRIGWQWWRRDLAGDISYYLTARHAPAAPERQRGRRVCQLWATAS
jgi:NitT/TauT family transport system permease protein